MHGLDHLKAEKLVQNPVSAISMKDSIYRKLKGLLRGRAKIKWC